MPAEPTRKPKARRGGRPPKEVGGKDKGKVCREFVERRGSQEACGQVLSNPKQANLHLARMHGLTGAAKARAFGEMGKPCPFEVVDGIRSKERDHGWKLMPDTDHMHFWCLGCGAVEEATKEANQRWLDDMAVDQWDFQNFEWDEVEDD